jgi:hypothetical protein
MSQVSIRRPFGELDPTPLLTTHIFSFQLDKPDFGGRQRAEGFGSHEEYKREAGVFSVLLDHLVSPVKHRLWDCKSDLLGGFKVYNQV